MWSLYDTSNATIDQNGFLTVKRNGNVVIYASATNSSGKRGNLSINIVFPTLGIEEAQKPIEEYSLFPNPANELITINSISNFTIEKIIVIDNYGNELIASTDRKTLNLMHLQNGLYVLKICSNNEIVYKKLVISH
jgi:hypothetical protein